MKNWYQIQIKAKEDANWRNWNVIILEKKESIKKLKYLNSEESLGYKTHDYRLLKISVIHEFSIVKSLFNLFSIFK